MLWVSAAVIATAAACATPGSPAARPRPRAAAATVPSAQTPVARHRSPRRRPLHAPAGRVVVSHPRVGRWLPVTKAGGNTAIDARVVALPDGVRVTVYRFRAGTTSFALYAGSQDPGPVRGSPHSTRVSGPERSRLLAAFNGAFKVSAGTGGYVQDGVVVRPLRAGLATFAIDTAGRGTVGVWRHGVPAVGQRVRSAIQNLAPLVAGGRMSPSIDDRLAWGATLGHVLDVARSGVGEDARGNVLYAASMAASPRDLALAMIATGAVDAMELDINPEWVQLDLAARPGGALHTGIPLQQRPARQLLTGWTRSFVAVLAGR